MSLNSLGKKTNEYRELKEKPLWQGSSVNKATVKNRDSKTTQTTQAIASNLITDDPNPDE